MFPKLPRVSAPLTWLCGLCVCVRVFMQTGQEHELIECMPLLEWFANSYKKFGATLEIVTDKSQEGSQFVKGFGGIGGRLNLKGFFLPSISSAPEFYSYYSTAPTELCV